MSTHIDGVLLDVPFTLPALLAWHQKVSPLLAAAAQREVAKAAVFEATDAHDRACLNRVGVPVEASGLPPGEGTFLDRAWQQVGRRRREAAGGRRDREIDVECRLLVHADPSGTGCAAIVQCENPVLREILFAQPQVRVWAYWDHTDDRPKGVSSRDWESRYAYWRSLVIAPDQPAVPLPLVLLASDVSLKQPTAEDVTSLRPSWARRIRRFSHEAATLIWAQERRDAGDTLGLGDYARMMSEITPTHPRYLAVAARIRAALPRKAELGINEDDLLNGLHKAVPTRRRKP